MPSEIINNIPYKGDDKKIKTVDGQVSQAGITLVYQLIRQSTMS